MAKKTTSRSAFPVPAAEDLRTTATDRAFNAFARAVSKETTKANEMEMERRKAFGATMNAWIETLDEDQRAGFFRSIEAVATAANARKIATHPLRPEELDDEVEAAEKEARSSSPKPSAEVSAAAE